MKSKFEKLEKLHDRENAILIIFNILLGYGGCCIVTGNYAAGIIFITLYIIGMAIEIYFIKRIIDTYLDIQTDLIAKEIDNEQS